MPLEEVLGQMEQEVEQGKLYKVRELRSKKETHVSQCSLQRHLQ